MGNHEMIKPNRLSATIYAIGLTTSISALATDYTPLGAEISGNPDGSIPPWTGGYNREANWTDIPSQFVDPFSGDKIKFSINYENHIKYKENLTAGQIEQLRKNPNGYQLNIYETRRTAKLPKHIYLAAQKNSKEAILASDGNEVINYEGYYPFIHPKTGLEALWNHLMRYRGGSLQRSHTQVITQSNGDYSEVQIEDRVAWPGNTTGFDPALDSNIMLFSTQKVTGPARLAGGILLVHETVNQVKQPRLAWLYNSGQRRVRRAPQVAYDGPGTASDGLRTADNYDMYSGAPDRYDWKLEGKQEVYIPYNNYRLINRELTSDKLIKKGHLNSEYLRYEKHRVWKVVGTLKNGIRHIYSKRVLYLDEDTWQIALAEHYDSRGNLWRLSEGFHVQYDYADTPWYAGEAIYDFNSGRYLALGLIYSSQQPISFGFKADKSQFMPAALRSQGIR